MHSISVDYLRECFTVCFETGRLWWKERPREHFKNVGRWSSFNKRFSGVQAFTRLNAHGYPKGGLSGKTLTAHRVIYALYTGEWPPADIDHINGKRDDNRITNLRPVTRQENIRNMRILDSNKSGITGVHWASQRSKWVARIIVSGKQISLGSYASLLDAAAARKSAEKELGFHPNHGRAR